MAVYINGAQAISPQDTFLNPQIPTDLKEYYGIMQCVLPDFKSYFKPIEMRRMSRIIKLSTAAAIECIKEADAGSIDAIITGTGLGCLEDTQKFLNKMLDNNEEMLTPTTFIQSTHNTPGGIIALANKCYEYNVTYAHKTISFESCLLDAVLLIKEGKKNILVGGFDEITEENYNLRKHINQWKEEPFSNLDIYNCTTGGYKAGEGAAYFMISSHKTPATYAELKMIDICHKFKNNRSLPDKVHDRLQSAGLSTEDIDLVIFGFNGDYNTDAYYHMLKDTLFKHQNHGYYKHYCGEYDTSASFGMWIATRIIKQNYLPENIMLGERKKEKINNLLLYNQEDDKNHSFIVLSAC